jgi:tetratricopeptide (TPR) repeat protein/tRNA A-37 threonylcarbamoyl transferase component Bud32
MIGTRLGHYQITDKLGEGGMGVVYKAHDPRLDRPVAIKVLPARLAADPTARERLRREAMAAAALDHPFICKVFEIGEADDHLFLVMEYIAGETLHHRLQDGAVEMAEALRITGEILDALEEAHNRRFVHRDLKPANVMVSAQGHVKVMDFGLAKRFEPDRPESPETLTSASPALTDAGRVVGTPGYMSPEQIRGQSLDPRSDLFSFGILLYELLTGEHPFRRETSAEMMAAILRDPPAIGDLAPGLAVLVRRLLAKLSAERYQSVTEVRGDLARISEGGALAGESAATPARLPMIGRDAEKEELLCSLEEAQGGRGSLVMIGGEPGIGKTRLTEEILAEARQRGFVTMTGHCYEGEGAAPYVPFVEMLEYSARSSPPATFRRALGDAAPEVARIMPELRRLFPDIGSGIELPPEQQRRYLFNAYREFVERACQVTPLAVVFEDLQWADEPTLLLLQHITQTVGTMPMLTMGTYRDVELEVTRPFAKTLETLLRKRQATRISLRRLPVEGVEEMLGAMSGQTPPDSLAAVIFEETEGNPFFVEEVFQHLEEEGKLFDEGGAWRPGLRMEDLQVPEGVRLVVGRRLERVGDDARRVLRTAGIIGRTFSLPLLETLETGDPDAALDAIEEAERARLVEPEPAGRELRYQFSHELIRQTLVDSVSLPRRQRLHARIAEAMERVYQSSLDVHAPALAHHLYQSGAAADPEKTTKYLLLAANQARKAAGHEEALAHLDNALSLWEGESSVRIAELHAERATALNSLGRIDAAVEAYERAIALYDAAGDVAKAAEISLPLGFVHFWNAHHEQGLAVTHRALDRLGEHNPTLRCKLLLLQASISTPSGDISGGLPILEQAKSLESTLAPGVLGGFSALCEAHSRTHFMQLDLSEEVAKRGAEASWEVGDLWGQVELDSMRVLLALMLGRLEEGRRAYEQAKLRAERIGHHSAAWMCRAGFSMECVARGELDAAEQAARESLRFVQSFRFGYRFLDELTLGSVQFYRGRSKEAADCLRRAIAFEPQGFLTGISRATLFSMLAREGDAGALEVLREAPPPLAVPGQVNASGAWASLAHVVEGLAVTRREEEAAALHPAAEDLAATGVYWYFGLLPPFRTAAGIAAACAREWTRAEEHHQTAIHQADTMPNRTAQPMARDWYAEMLLARRGSGDRERARVLLGEALSMYESLGMPGFARRASKQLGTGG